MNILGLTKKTVSRDEIIWCYRHILGREPESEAALTPHLTHTSFRSLAESFASSDEAIKFREAGARVIHNRQPLTYIAAPTPDFIADKAESAPVAKQPLEIETVASVEQLSACLARARGDRERSLSVAAKSKSESPEALSRLVFATLARHGAPAGCPGVFVELGFGVASVTMEVATKAEHLHAYEISQSLIASARNRAQTLGFTNLLFHELDVPPLDAVHGCHYLYALDAFQYCPPPLIATFLRKGLRALVPGGLAIFRLSTNIENYEFKLSIWLNEADDRAFHPLPMTRVLEIVSGQGCELLAVENDDGMSSVLVIRKQS